MSLFANDERAAGGEFSAAEVDDVRDEIGIGTDGGEVVFGVSFVPPEFERRKSFALGEVKADSRSERVGFVVNARRHFAFDLGGVAELKRAEGHVDSVAGHVTEGAGAEIAPAAPFEVMVEAVDVRTHLGRPNPGIPV